SLDEIWASFNSRSRRGIRRVNAHSPEIQQTDDVSPMLDIWRPRFSELGIEVPLLSDDYLKDLVAAFPQEMTVYNLIIDGQLATAIACCVIEKDRYCYWIGNASARKDLYVNEYLIWEVVKKAKSEGFKKLDLGESTEVLSRFKSKFDPVLEPFCVVDKADTAYKVRDFAYKKLSGAKKLASDALVRAHR
ncbi:MAG: GNAT family N-acetyltransferase, partial [Halobacteriota archaeon]